MKKIAFLLCFVLLFAIFAINVSAAPNTTLAVASSSGINNLSTWQIGIVAMVMFTVISVIGVMFIKIVIKNKNDRR